MTLTEPLLSEVTLECLIGILSITIKKDDTCKVVCFLNGILAQTTDSQMNIILSQQSCTGKSYILKEIADFFPKDEILEFASASPSSLIHSPNARLGYKIGDTWHFVAKGEKMPKGKYCQSVHDYKHKIIIFLDQPKPELLAKMRAFLSHDNPECNFSVVDKTKSGSMRTVENILLGYPSVFFAMVEPNLDMQESTRAIILSPEASPEKTRMALKLAVQKSVHREAYTKEIESNPERLALKNLVKEIRASGIREVEFDENADEFISSKLDVNNPRATRDVQKILNLAKAWALLNFRSRERKNKETLLGKQEDLETALKIYEPIMIPNTIGVRPEIWQFFKDILEPEKEPVTISWIQRRYADKYGRVIGLEDLRNYLKVLENKGYITKEKNPNDSRSMLYSAIK